MELRTLICDRVNVLSGGEGLSLVSGNGSVRHLFISS